MYDEEAEEPIKPKEKVKKDPGRKPVKKVRAKKKPVRKKRTPAKGTAQGSGAGNTGRDEARVRKREARRRRVRRQKILIAAALAAAVVIAVISAVRYNSPSARFERCLAEGDRFTGQEDYAGAQTAYEEALSIDPDYVEGYRRIADNYLAQDKPDEAKQILYKGWEQTQDEGLRHYYCVEVFNEAAGEINAGSCSLETVDKGIQILELEGDNTDAVSLLDNCFRRLLMMSEEEDTCMLFFDADASQDTCSYAEYEQLVRRMLTVYGSTPTDALKELLIQYVLIDTPYVRFSMAHVDQYAALLADVNDKVQDPRVEETIACLERAGEIREYFAPAFAKFESGDFTYARELVTEESYQEIRDSFINGNSGYWEGSVYIPVNKELLVLHREEDKIRFYFPDETEYDNRQGIITVWGTHQEDDGVQRSVVSYEPVQENGDGSHTEYTVQYLYSNVKINGSYVPQMNYRFDTKVTTDDGITTNAIGDWGGEHEWEIDY